MAMESSVLVQPKRPDWHKHEQMQIHHTKSMPFLILNEYFKNESSWSPGIFPPTENE